jgi:tRNA 2-thiouridine synthesizing protein A
MNTDEFLLDTKGLKCPLPVLKARKALKEVAPGGLLRVLATDPGARKDFAHFCDATGCELIESSEGGDGVLSFLIRKPAG